MQGVVSFQELDTDEMTGEDMISDLDTVSVEDMVIFQDMRDRLHQCMKQLLLQEEKLLHALYFCGHSERRFAQLSGIPRMTIHGRKVRALRNLKN